ncbi:MAG TPA: hypothetical protein VIL04_13770 [Solirubrobacterales bacterium]|jgi:hypothetical protein
MEMDIYMRRRLVALAILVGIIILFILLIRSCGGDDEESPITPVGATGAGGAQPLTQEQYIDQADAICAEANTSINRIDPAAEDAILEELQLTEQALVRLESLEPPADAPGSLNRFLRQMNRLVDGLDTLQTALERGDAEAQATAEAAIAEARERAASAAESFGFRECGEFGEPGTDTADTEEGTAEEGATAPPATTPQEAAPPAQTTPPPATEAPSDGGGDTGGGTPPADSSGGLSP